jgi:23S rRNA (cytidine1920-2'-O)/16S rRNA (cytidine1409-2'-O)-methyltransferase
MKQRLDQALAEQGLVSSRSQAGSYIKLGKAKVDGKVVTKPGLLVGAEAKISLDGGQQYVSRAALKLASVTEVLDLNFQGKTVLDVGSSTGGFTDFALRAGAKKVIAVDVGTDQMHPSLRGNPRIELHEKTDIRDLVSKAGPWKIDIVVVDVSFISLREVLPAISKLSKSSTQIVVLLKPQFEAGKDQINRGIVKNDKLRRQILKNFESWAKAHFVIAAKADSQVAGAHGNIERFYLLRPKA